MGLFGELLSIPLKIVNAPLRATEVIVNKVVDPLGKKLDDDERVISAPLKALSDEIEKI